MKEECKICQRPLTADEVAVTRKLISRGAKEFYCTCCLAGHFRVTPEVIEEKIRYFKSIGCILFTASGEEAQAGEMPKEASKQAIGEGWPKASGQG